MSALLNRFLRVLVEVFTPGYRALRLYWLPFTLIQLIGITIAVSYYHSPHFQVFCNEVAKWKSQGGMWTSAWLAGLCWGLMPEALKAITGRGRPLNLKTLSELFFLFCVFGGNGILVQVFYGYQTQLFGDTGNFSSVFPKVLFDQFFFTPVICYPYTILLFKWKECDYRILPTLKSLSWRLYVDRVKPLLFLGWLYWFPMVSCIYAMPTPVQVPLNICISTAWVMLLVFILEACENQEPQQEVASLPLQQGGD